MSAPRREHREPARDDTGPQKPRHVFGSKDDGTYVLEFKTEGEALAVSIRAARRT